MRMVVRKRQHRAPPSDRTDRSVPPLYFCLRTLSRRRTRSISFRRVAPLSRVHIIARFVCLRVSGAVAPSAPAQGRSLPLQCELNRHLLNIEVQISNGLGANCHPPLVALVTTSCGICTTAGQSKRRITYLIDILDAPLDRLHIAELCIDIKEIPKNGTRNPVANGFLDGNGPKTLR